VLSDNCNCYLVIIWFETRTLVSNFAFGGKYGFKLVLKPKHKRHFMFRLNFGFKPFFGFKPRFYTLVLIKDKVTHCL